MMNLSVDVVGITSLIAMTIFICWRYESLAYKTYTFPSVLVRLSGPALLNLTMAYCLMMGSIWFIVLGLIELFGKLALGMWWNFRPGPWPSEYGTAHSLMSYWRHLMLDMSILGLAWLTVWVGGSYG